MPLPAFLLAAALHLLTQATREKAGSGKGELL
ncbi:hypothetical protein QE390_004620 [Siphonobacter sp. SORGH_AS 1065]|nr:hypothetical protein [Siphonobacter sp. SORGH_AS_1065]